MTVKPVKAFLTAGWIGIASGRYDATLEITTADGYTCQVPYVRLAPSVADAMMRIAYEVRTRKQTKPDEPTNPQQPTTETN